MAGNRQGCDRKRASWFDAIVPSSILRRVCVAFVSAREVRLMRPIGRRVWRAWGCLAAGATPAAGLALDFKRTLSEGV